MLAGAAIGATCALIGAPSGLPLFEARLAWQQDAPAPGDWPHPARAGESAELVSGPRGLELSVRAPRAPRVRELATELARSASAGVNELLSAREGLEERWRARLQPAPLPPFSPGAEGAAWLLARAQYARDLAGALPARYAGTSPPAPAPSPPPALSGRITEFERAALAGVPDTLRAASLAELAEEDTWFASGVPSREATPATRGGAWRAWQLARADSLETRAAAMLAVETPLQQALARAGRDERVLELSTARRHPFAALAASTPDEAPIVALPLARAWARLLGTGALLGALVAGLAAYAGAWSRRARRAEPARAEALRDPGAAGPWLHVVAGPTSFAISRAVLELAAHGLARHERVLVIDGAPRLKLHERFEREARWGLMECLLADMPMLGLIQYGGRPGLYLLAHGNSARGEGWLSLGRRLEDVRPHFGRVVLALDVAAPRQIGDSLAGRALEGWWAAGAQGLPRAAIELSARLGIAFSGIDLAGMPEASLEELSDRVEELEALYPAPLRLFRPEPAAVDPAPAAAAPEEPIVLDCDLQVRQRLRFLAWMRRVQSETRTAGNPAETISR